MYIFVLFIESHLILITWYLFQCDICCNANAMHTNCSTGLWFSFAGYNCRVKYMFIGFLHSLESMVKILVVLQSGKVWRKFIWSVTMEKENNFPNLIVWHTFSCYFIRDRCDFTYIMLIITVPVFNLGRSHRNIRSGKSLEIYFQSA